MIQYELLLYYNGGGSFLSYSKRATHSPPWMAPGYQQQQWTETGTTILICAFIASQFAFVQKDAAALLKFAADEYSLHLQLLS